ncbi:unnamed protein product [Cylindrotheca closterium]|uniref:Uncharacterized protein n=1 Tax=Cylindrotheca closterium TaxID=2856 RepID=A0AAD2CZH5_9STRA|nr:unnamed protein product [Cylindrotheca closterium]
MLPRTSQKLCENDDISVLTKKEIIFHSFPAKWQDTFHQQKGTIEDPNITLQMVKTYMQATKILSDNVQISKQHAHEKPQRTGGSIQHSCQGRGRGRGCRSYGNRRTTSNPPYPSYQIKELRIKDIAILQDLKATIKDNLWEPVLEPKDALGNATIKPICLQTTDLQGIFKTETLKTIIMLNHITIKTEVKPKAQFLLERITTIRKRNALFRLELPQSGLRRNAFCQRAA